MITISLIVIVSIISFIGFANNNLYNGLMFLPYKKYQLYRNITYAFVHINHIHLLLNMFNLLLFGVIAEKYIGDKLYILFCISSIIVCIIPYQFRQIKIVGFSGVISGIIYLCVFHYPILFWISIPYLIYTWYADNHMNDSIAHASHLYGMMYAFFFELFFFPQTIFNIFVP